MKRKSPAARPPPSATTPSAACALQSSAATRFATCTATTWAAPRSHAWLHRRSQAARTTPTPPQRRPPDRPHLYRPEARPPAASSLRQRPRRRPRAGRLHLPGFAGARRRDRHRLQPLPYARANPYPPSPNPYPLSPNPYPDRKLAISAKFFPNQMRMPGPWVLAKSLNHRIGCIHSRKSKAATNHLCTLTNGYFL